MPVEVKLFPQVADDFAALPTDTLRREAMRWIVRLKTHPHIGRPLGDHVRIGDLSQCRKIYFDESVDVSPGWRIVYRMLPDSRSPTVVEIVAVGARDQATVYRSAVIRLRELRP